MKNIDNTQLHIIWCSSGPNSMSPVEDREEGLYEQGVSKLGWGHPQRQLTQACGSSWTLDQQLGSIHWMDLGLLHVGDSYVAWYTCGVTSSETRICPSTCTDSLETIPYGGVPLSALMQGKELGPASV